MQERFDVTTPDGRRLSVHRFTIAGASERTPTVLMAHGWAATHESWRPVIERLPRLAGDVRLVAWDQRGHGASRVGLSGRQLATLTVANTGRDLHAVLAAAVPEASPVVLAGHSLGAMTVLSYAAEFPREVRDRVRGVLLLAAAYRTDRTDGRGHRLGETSAMRLLTRGLPVRVGRALPLRMVRRTAFGPTAEEEWVRRTRDQVASTTLTVLGAFRGALPAPDEARSLAALHGIPVEILVGALDRMTPTARSEELHARLPGSRLAVLPGKGHMLTYEATEAVCQALLDLVDPGAQHRTPPPD